MKKPLIFFAILLTFSTVPMLVSVGQTQSGSLPVAGNNAPALQMLTTTADTFTARFTLPELKITTPAAATVDDARDSGTEIHFAGANWTLDVGKPRLPIYTQRIGIPIAGTPVVTIIQARSETKTIENVRVTPDDPVFPTLVSENPPVLQKFYPTQLVEVIPSGFVRDQRIGSLQINPVQYNPATKQLKIFASVTFRVHFPGAVSAGGTIATAPLSFGGSPRVFEDLFQSTLRNYEQAKPWRKQRQSSYGGLTDRNYAPGAPTPITANTRRFKISVAKTDLYRITYNNIKAYTGIEPETINLDTLQLESSGAKQGLYIFDENENDTLDPGEQIVFYGRALADNKFTDQNVYWLRFGLLGEPAAGLETSRVTTRDGTPKLKNLVVPTAFLARTRLEENWHHDVLNGYDVKSELADHYFGTAFRGGDRKDFPIELPNAAPRLDARLEDNVATLRIKFQGASRRGNARHRARIIFNNVQLDRPEEWKRQTSQVAARDVLHTRIFSEHTNLMRIEALDRNDTPPGSYDFYLDWYELDYWRNFQAERNRLEFNTKTTPRNRGQVQYQVGNIFSEKIDVYQLDENGISSKLIGGEVTRAGASHRIRFEDTVNQYTRYFVISRGAYQSINALVPIPPTPLRNPANRVDYVVITHSTFTESIEPLVEFRRSQGLTTMVVDIDDIYNEFSDGLFNPFAIQKFLRYAYNNWQQPAPTYVLLVGDAHYDYKRATVEIHRREFGNTYNLYPIFVPTYHGWAPESGETSMDQRFVNVSGDDPLPDMLIGRLSVQTPETLDDMVEKIINYEKNLQTGLWQGTLIQVADDHLDKPNDSVFEESRDELIQEVIPAGYDTRQIYLRKVKSPELTRSMIKSAINKGALAIEYTGHGGIQTWADESIFRIEDVVKLRNSYLPFVITTTCLNGQFDKPQQTGNFCLSEQFLFGKYGAIAALSATRLTYGSANAEFDKDLFEALFRAAPESPELATKSIPFPPTIGHIVADAKISFLNRIRNPSWIPGTEQYTLFGDPASRLARPQLNVKVELERVALGSQHQIVIKANEVGVVRESEIGETGSLSFTRIADFSTEAFSAFAIFANNFDDNLHNDITRRTGGRIWKGEYGTIRMDVPNNARPGQGIARIFAFDDTHAAIGGARFWIDTPVLYDLQETLDTKITDTLNISALVLDDKGPAGIRSIRVVWDNTNDFEVKTTPMVPARTPLGDVPPGGQWYELETPIFLPRAGVQIRYQVFITDSSGHEIIIPSKFERNVVRAPLGPNIAIGTDKIDRPPIRYVFDEKKDGYQLVAELINNGGRPVIADIEVVFAEGNPDPDGDSIIDEDANILGTVTVKPTDWVEGTYVWQRVTVILDLEAPLKTGPHKIYVFADPEDPDIEDDIADGNVEEARIFDNKQHVSFVVNDFNYIPEEALLAFSLDRVFDIHFPPNVIEVETRGTAGIPLSVTSQLPTDPSQPDLQFAPIPRVAALRRGLIRQGTAVAQYYEPTFRTNASVLAKPAELKFRFDVSALEDIVRKETEIQPDNPAFEYEFTQVTNQVAIYAWQTDLAPSAKQDTTSTPAEVDANLSAWRRLPSQINYTPEGDFLLENYVTPTQMENASEQKLETDAITINSSLTPAGTWIIMFLDPNEYEVFLKRKGEQRTEIEKLDQTGQLDNPFRVEVYGLELRIPSQVNPSADVNYKFEFADILAFKTDYNPQGDVILEGTWNANLGNGTATVNNKLGPKKEFETGDWFLFFIDPNYYEIRDASNAPVHYPNGVKVHGRVNEPLFLSHLGFEMIVNAGPEAFGFGDKVKFSSARVATITTEVSELKRFALMRSTDNEPPAFSLWVDGVQPQTGSVIPPRPTISIVLQDANGVDVEFFTFDKQKNDGPFEPVTDYELRAQSSIDTAPIDYRPILFPGEYTFNIGAQDFNGNAIGGDAGIVSYRFVVIEEPDITPPTIEVQVTGSGTGATDELLDASLTNGTILTEQPRFKIAFTDDSALDETTFRVNFGSVYETLELLDPNSYTETFDPDVPADAAITYAPDLANGEYQLQITAADTSGNIGELVTAFTLNEEVTLSEVFNVPNPTYDGKTFFTYHLAQAPDTVTIKIYSINGRLLRTLDDARANRGTNETGWDGKDEDGIRCANGVYLYRVTAHTEDRKIQQVGKLAILR